MLLGKSMREAPGLTDWPVCCGRAAVAASEQACPDVRGSHLAGRHSPSSHLSQRKLTRPETIPGEAMRETSVGADGQEHAGHSKWIQRGVRQIAIKMLKDHWPLRQSYAANLPDSLVWMTRSHCSTYPIFLESAHTTHCNFDACLAEGSASRPQAGKAVKETKASPQNTPPAAAPASAIGLCFLS